VQELTHWFVVLADEENVTAAAARLHVPQPTLSRRLSQLERRLGARLFDRVGRRIRLNAAGRAYLEHVRRADHELGAAAEAVRDLTAAEVPSLRLGFLHSFGTWLVPDLIQRLRAHEPAVHVDLVQGGPEHIGGLLLAGEVDLAIVSPRPASSRLGWRRLQRQQVRLLVPRGHRLAVRRSVRFDTLRDAEFVAMQPGYSMRQTLDEACAASGFEPHIAVECQELETVAGLVAVGIGIALVPAEQHGRPSRPDVVAVPVSGVDVTRDIGLAWSLDRPLSRIARTARTLAPQPVPD
jgi:DNA-binding transcriptional LysR family regulator